MVYLYSLLLTSIVLLNVSCVTRSHHESNYYETSQVSVLPGSAVMIGKQKLNLYDGKIKVGNKFKRDHLGININFDNQVAVINILPSLDTAACEAQTHLLGESMLLDKRVKRVVISRDLPMAQDKFKKSESLSNISYFSDYKYGSFGKWSGLLIKGEELLTRGVVVVDRKGVIRHMQIVENIAKLPDMKKAFIIANALLAK